MRTKYGWLEKRYEFWYDYVLYKLEVYEDRYVIIVPRRNATIVVSKENIESCYRNILSADHGLPTQYKAGIRSMLREYIPSLREVGTAGELLSVVKKIKNMTKQED